MSDLLLDTADNLRERAQRCRLLAQQTIDPKVVSKLLHLADELDVRAEAAERQAEEP